jgi:nucleoside 2-deoxyribosyltransferase
MTESKYLFICYALEGELVDDLRERIELITDGARDAGMETYAHIRDEQHWRAGRSSIKSVLKKAFERIEKAEAVFLDLTTTKGSKRVGLNIEAGYAKALRKPIVALYHESERPNMTTDLADVSSSYSERADIRKVTCQLLSEINSSTVTDLHSPGRLQHPQEEGEGTTVAAFGRWPPQFAR